MNNTFLMARFSMLQCEYLAWCGQPMLYDGDIYVVRTPHNEMTQTEYYRWVKGIRCV
jgi:hypothetical protein